MALMSENDRTSGSRKSGYNETATTSNFKNQQGKPFKALIGVVLLVVLAVVLAWMNPAQHETSAVPSWSTGQTTETDPPPDDPPKDPEPTEPKTGKEGQ